MKANRQKVLVVDDDPTHLEIYGFIVDRAGYEAVAVPVDFSGMRGLPDASVGLVLLDYRLNSVKTAPELAQEIQVKYPNIPIIVLSDLWTLPDDIAPYTREFVRKGEPEKLIDIMMELLPPESS